jgi:hypothetical protein
MEISDEAPTGIATDNGVIQAMKLLDGSVRIADEDGEEFHVLRRTMPILRGASRMIALLQEHFYSKRADDRFVRAHPRVSEEDTQDGGIPYHDGRRVCIFSARVILERMPDRRIGWLAEEDRIEVRRSDFNGRHILLQSGQRGCTAGAVAMLLLDHGRRPDPRDFQEANFEKCERMAEQIRRAGLSVHLTPGRMNAHELERLLAARGPGIVGVVTEEAGGHVIMLDAVALKEGIAVIRDPFHGWQIRITLEALMRSGPGDFLQIDHV